nr:MAG TPA: hydrolase [Caudoviricetes sp.]
MFATFQTIINAGGYDLSDLTERIKTLYAMGELTEDEMKQLLEQAQHNAKPDDSYAPLADRVKTIEEWETTVEERLSKLETGSSTNPGEPEEPADEWPEYVQPTGEHDAYHNGDQITWNSQHYRCVAPVGTACVWNPDTYPAYWTLVE